MANDLKSFTEQRLKELGLGPVDAAVRGGLERTFISNILSGKKETIKAGNIMRLALALEVQPEDVMAALNMPVLSRWRDDSKGGSAVPIEAALPERMDMPRDVPVYGTALGSIINRIEGFSLNGNVIDYVRRPPALINGREVYAIYVQGESMVPAFFPSDLCFVHPNRPAAPGDFVIVQTKNYDDDPGQAYIKRLVKHNAERTILEQFNPGATIEIPGAHVASVHRVLRTNELFGF